MSKKKLSKVIILGDSAVGKTSLLNAYVSDEAATSTRSSSSPTRPQSGPISWRRKSSSMARSSTSRYGTQQDRKNSAVWVAPSTVEPTVVYSFTTSPTSVYEL